MTRILSLVTAGGFLLVQAGCAVRCGPLQTVPAQKVRLIADSPTEYFIRVIMDDDAHTDTKVAADGRVSFAVPVTSFPCTPYLFGVIKVGWPTPVVKRRVIQVMRGESAVVRKLSARDIAGLQEDASGFRLLKVER